MFKLGSKYTLYIIIAVAIIGILVFIYFIGRRSAKTKIEQVSLPSDQPGGKILTTQDNSQVRNISESLHKDMDGFNWSHDMEPYKKLVALSDTLFVAVYNDFNNLYASENEGTLRDWVNGEVGSSWNPDFEMMRQSILSRMDRLNLR